MIDAEGHVKLTDFGLSKDGLENNDGFTESFCGTQEYLAPEIITEKKYSYSVDWYSLGILLFEMVSGTNPFKKGFKIPLEQQLNEILKADIKMPAFFSAELSDLCKRLIKKKVSEIIMVIYSLLCSQVRGSAVVRKVQMKLSHMRSSLA